MRGGHMQQKIFVAVLLIHRVYMVLATKLLFQKLGGWFGGREICNFEKIFSSFKKRMSMKSRKNVDSFLYEYIDVLRLRFRSEGTDKELCTAEQKSPIFFCATLGDAWVFAQDPNILLAASSLLVRRPGSVKSRLTPGIGLKKQILFLVRSQCHL